MVKVRPGNSEIITEKEHLTKMEKLVKEGQQHRSTSKQVILGLIAYFSTVAPSMSLGFSAVALPQLLNEDNPFKLTPSEASWFASIAAVATPVGCFLSGPVSDKFGRKTALLCINVVTFIGWVVIAVAYNILEDQYYLLLVGRIITGTSTGLASMPAVIYMAEICSPDLRMMFTTAAAIFFSFGILTVYFLGYLFKDDWGRIALITSAIPCFSMFIGTIFLPESPQWLVSKNREEEARRSMVRIFGYKDCNKEINEEVQSLIINREKSKIKSGKADKSTWASLRKKCKYFFRPTCLKPFVIILLYFFFQQFSGVFVIIFYAIDIVKEAGVTVDPYAAIVAIAATRLFGAIFVFFASKRLGRRPPSIMSGAGMTICMLVLFVYLYLINTGKIDEDTVRSLSWLTMVMLVLYFFVSTIGFLTVPFAMAGEVFPTKIRGLATGLVTCCAYSFNFVTVKTYPAMIETMGNHGVFLFYGCVSLVGTIFLIAFLPETKGKTLQEIEEYFGKRKKVELEKVSIIRDGHVTSAAS